ncbi:MAG: hypothetical protein COT74_05745 [Bdellovibrionales bacterium CG10_big_fil_rev_8_21_14_0_10_45_34]|nr:MAG: hypothetical protein COT74_05745 [Bdellovibrionales bacterium CG10_big_fil_rev_8_21_14_0_10_45_34]
MANSIIDFFTSFSLRFQVVASSALVLLAVSAMATSAAEKQNDPSNKLKLISSHQPPRPSTKAFDLSGLLVVDDHLLLLSDKPWDRFLYLYESDGPQLLFRKKLPIEGGPSKPDFEALAMCKNTLYLADENDQTIWTGKLEFEEKKFLKVTLTDSVKVVFYVAKKEAWKKNAGIEGVAVDCQKNLLYALKERQPRRIYEIDLKSQKITRDFDIKGTDGYDFSDAQFENGHLYILERSAYKILKYDLKSKTVVDSVSYKEFFFESNQPLFGPTPYALEEALFLSKEFIWIGTDNNDLKSLPWAEKRYKFSGKAPVIMKFQRPKEF